MDHLLAELAYADTATLPWCESNIKEQDLNRATSALYLNVSECYPMLDDTRAIAPALFVERQRRCRACSTHADRARY